MAKCDVCGNDYDKSFEIIKGGESRTFDCFECAIHAMAPRCAHCGCKIIGHGMEVGAHCAQQHTVSNLKDRVDTEESAQRHM